MYSGVPMKNFSVLCLLVVGLFAAPHGFAESSEGSSFSASDLQVAPEDGAVDPLITRLSELVSKGKAQNSSSILVDAEVKELKVLINHFGWNRLKTEGILTRGEYQRMLQKRSQEQRNLWRTLGPQDAMNDVRLTASMRLNKCNYRAQADYFMNVEEDAIGHRIGMAEVYSDNNLSDPDRRQRVKQLTAKTNGDKRLSSKAFASNKGKCRTWVRDYHAWLKKYEAEIKNGVKPNEAQPLFVLDVR